MAVREGDGGVVRLRDTLGQNVYTVNTLPANIVSGKELVVKGADHEVCVVAPGKSGEEYSIVIDGGTPPTLHVLLGHCNLNGTVCTPNSSTPALFTPGSFITLGSSTSLQYVSPEGGSASRRKLPPTPGKSVQPSPPAKPRRQRQPQILQQLSSLGAMPTEDPGLRPRLQRIAAEVSARLGGYEDRKPPPPYEQVGNSIGYQLLHQNRHRDITPQLIDALYPPLKENITKDTSLEATYSSYLAAYRTALSVAASPECKLPADHPTIDFIVDLLLHVCCMPHMTGLAEKQGHVWMKTLAVFSVSPQNHTYLVVRRYPSKILSCMHLSMMSEELRFQQHGWTLLSHCLPVPPKPGNKPVLSEASLTLALCLAEGQLDKSYKDVDLMFTNVQFLAQVAVLAKAAITTKHTNTCIYTPHQALQILALFQDRGILRHIMKIPSELRSGKEFEYCYSNLVKALVPRRGQPMTTGSRRKSSTPLSSNKSLTQHRLQNNSTSSVKSLEESSIGDNTESPSNPHLPGSLADHMGYDVEGSTDDLLKSYSTPLLGSCYDFATPTSEPVVMATRSASCSDLLEDHTTHEDVESGGPTHSPVAMTPVGSQVSPHEGGEQAIVTDDVTDDVITGNTENSLEHKTSDQNDVVTMTTTQQVATSTDSTHHNPQGDHTHLISSNSEMKSHTHSNQEDSTHQAGHTHSVQEDPIHSEQNNSSQPLPPTPPLSPCSAQMSEDVQELLELLKAPLEPTSGNIVRVPSLSRNNRYYRHSMKHRHTKITGCHDNQVTERHDNQTTSRHDNHEVLPVVDQEERERMRKEAAVECGLEEKPSCTTQSVSLDDSHGVDKMEGNEVQEGKENLDKKVSEDVTDEGVEKAWSQQLEHSNSHNEEICSSPLTPSRMEWRSARAGHSIHDNDPSSLFEVSGQHFSLKHSIIEDVTASHGDVNNTLVARHQMLQNVLSLWSQGKGLQAATNLLQACFSDQDNDVTLFMDTLPCLLAHRSPWTLAVCVVLLPPLHQLLSVHCLQRHVKVLCDVVHMIVDRFTNLILAWQGSKGKKRLSASVDREQQIICYKELHALRHALHHRLDNSSSLPTQLTDHLRKLHAALRPFKQTH